MRIDIITVLPEMLEGFVHESILARAEKKGLAEIRLHNLRDYTKDKWRRVDDYPFNFIILAGHYKGVDQRVRDHLITREISVGDFVLTGGELPAAIIADAVVRLVPGVISDEQSALSDCFMDDMLSAPIYTRPRSYNGWDVPEILLSGNEAKIRQWEFDQAMERTKRLRPDLLKE